MIVRERIDCGKVAIAPSPAGIGLGFRHDVD
jgi:hypothetical protein